jgi:hypothetical protein
VSLRRVIFDELQLDSMFQKRLKSGKQEAEAAG